MGRIRVLMPRIAVVIALAAGLVAPQVAGAAGSGSFGPTGSMSTPRTGAVAATLPDGRVLVAGGSSGSGPLASAELFNPATNSFSPLGVGMISPRIDGVAVSLLDGRVLIAGGNNFGSAIPNAEVFNPATGGFTAVGPLGTARYGFAAAPLPDGRLLVAGGCTSCDNLASAEIFAMTNTFTFRV
jgi:hypothetical protein